LAGLLETCGGGPKTSGSGGQALLSVTNGPRQATWTRNFNPLHPGALFPSLGGIYEPLLVFNRVKGTYVPWLASSYSWTTDNTRLTFEVRPGVKWSDGNPFSATDVVFTFDLLRRHKELDTRRVWEFLSDVKAPTGTSVEFTFRRAYTPGLVFIGHQVIVPEHAFKGVPDPATFLNETPVATGPFTVVKRFEPGVYELGRNEAYWQPGKPAVAGLRFPAFASNEQAIQALVGGQLDWAGLFVPDVDATFVAKDRAHNRYWFPALGNAVVLFVNSTRKPLGDASVRKALSMAIDRPRIVKEAMQGYAVPLDATGLADADLRWKDPRAVNAGNWTRRDLARANALLDAAGLTRGPDGARRGPGGDALRFTIDVVAGWSDWEAAASIIALNLKEVGITATVAASEHASYLDKVRRGSFDLCVGSSQRGPTPYNFYRGLMASEATAPIGELAYENYGRFTNKEVDETLRKFEATNDGDTRKLLNGRIQALFVEYAPALPLFPGPSWGEYTSKRFTGFPDESNPYAKLAPHDDPEPLLVMVEVQPQAN
jgi:peptide/nickel transport system substrate-binding protein